MGCCQPREKMDEKVAKAMYGEQADQAPRKKKEAYCSWCYEFSVHYFIKETSTWLCDACKGRTAESPRCQDSMARLEGKGKSGAVCAKSMPDWEEVCDKKKKVLSKARSLTKIRYEMTRWCPFTEEGFGDAHEEAWMILNKKGLGLRARCVRGLNKINPFAGNLDWVGVLNHVAQTLYVPSYMSWSDEFACEKMSKGEGKEESMHVHSRKVDVFEAELMEKVSKQQRGKMNRVQVCTVAQLMTTDNLRKLMAIQQARGVERHTMSLFAIDSCYLQLARDKHIASGQNAAPVQADELAGAVANFLSNGVDGDLEMFAEAGLKETAAPAPESILNANFEPLWLTLGTLGMTPHSTMSRVLPVMVNIFLQKEKLNIAQINISAPEFQRK